MHTEMNEKKNTCVGDEEVPSERSLKPVCAVDMGMAWWGISEPQTHEGTAKPSAQE